MTTFESYTDDTGRQWRIHEFLSYEDGAMPRGELPKAVRSGLVFESDGKRRIADNAPLHWRLQGAAGLEALFARSVLASTEY